MNGQPNMGKQIKDLGVLIIIVGAIFTAVIILGIMGESTQSLFYIIANRHFLFLILGSLICYLIGIIVRSIGRSLEIKLNNNSNNNEQH